MRMLQQPCNNMLCTSADGGLDVLCQNAKLIFVLIVRRFTWSWLQHGGVPARLRPRSDLRRLQRSHTCVVMVSGYSSTGDVPVY